MSDPKRLVVPNLSLVLLVGASGSGKSSFARAHFKPTEVLSQDYCRGLVADDQNDQPATGDAFDGSRYIARERTSNSPSRPVAEFGPIQTLKAPGSTA